MGIRKHYSDWEYLEMGMDRDHVHLHIVIPPKYAVSKVVETIKSNTSKQLKEKFKFLGKVSQDGGGIRSKGYFVSTVGINEEIVRNYVKLQGEEDKGQAELVL